MVIYFFQISVFITKCDLWSNFYVFIFKKKLQDETRIQIKKQHEEINQLNKELGPFKIFKGIESDILNDGSLDYDNDILASFDFIVASIHSNLNMDRDKATQRLIKAIENPYTTMLGHPTGRLLLNRKAYPINHKRIIDACARRVREIRRWFSHTQSPRYPRDRARRAGHLTEIAVLPVASSSNQGI